MIEFYVKIDREMYVRTHTSSVSVTFIVLDKNTIKRSIWLCVLKNIFPFLPFSKEEYLVKVEIDNADYMTLNMQRKLCIKSDLPHRITKTIERTIVISADYKQYQKLEKGQRVQASVLVVSPQEQNIYGFAPIEIAL